jgi:hypothetical protein
MVGRDRPRPGRVEAGLDRELGTKPEIGKAERAALRAQARAVDRAEAASDTDGVSRANAVYLDLRRAAGLTGGPVTRTADAFDVWLAEISRPGPGASDPAES